MNKGYARKIKTTRFSGGCLFVLFAVFSSAVLGFLRSLTLLILSSNSSHSILLLSIVYAKIRLLFTKFDAKNMRGLSIVFCFILDFKKGLWYNLC